jgi:hypothetical protein
MSRYKKIEDKLELILKNEPKVIDRADAVNGVGASV